MPRPRPTEEKRCPDCSTVKKREDFYQSDKYDGGLSPYCKECARLRNNGRWTAEREKMRRQQRESYHRNKHKHCEAYRARTKACSVRQKQDNPAAYRANKFFAVKRKGVSADVTRQYLEGLFRSSKNCACCGKTMACAYEPRTNRKFRSNPNSPSIDRVDNSKGYTRDNIAVICWQCNYRKSDLTLSDLDRLRAYITGGSNV